MSNIVLIEKSNNKRIKREKLLLPMGSKANPDYEFMKNYMKNVEYKK